jgi:tripartite ATP-independent transporter DctP family solute receptor
MLTKQKNLLMVLCLLMVFVFSNLALAANKITIRCGSIQAENFYLHDYVRQWASLVAKKTAGRVEVKLFPSSVLGNERDMLEGLRMGTLEAVLGYTAVPATIEPRIDITNLPFIFKDYDHVHKVLNGPIGKELGDSLLQKSNIRVLYWIDHAFRQVFTRDKAINKIEDFKGLKLRTPENSIYITIFRTLGANPTPLPFGDIYTSVQTKVVDGHEQEFSGMLSMKFYEVEKYCAITNHLYNGSALYMSEAFLKGLPKDIQTALQKSAVQAGLWFRKHGGGPAQKIARKELEKNGVKITTLKHEELVKKLMPIQDKYAKKIGATDLLRRIRKLSK